MLKNPKVNIKILPSSPNGSIEPSLRNSFINKAEMLETILLKLIYIILT